MIKKAERFPRKTMKLLKIFRVCCILQRIVL